MYQKLPVKAQGKINFASRLQKRTAVDSVIHIMWSQKKSANAMEKGYNAGEEDTHQ